MHSIAPHTVIYMKEQQKQTFLGAKDFHLKALIGKLGLASLLCS